MKDYAGILKSLLKFHANVSRAEGFDRRISSFWARHWLTWVYYFWFAPRVIKNTPRQRRIETLESVFKDGFDDFDALSRAASRARRIAGGFVKLFVRHPNLAWLVDVFFAYIYYPLVGIRDSINKTE